MKAWRLHSFGLENLKLDEIERPVPAGNQVVVQVGSVSLNYRDKAIMEGNYDPTFLKDGPLILVSDAVGKVIETGINVTRFKVGDRIITHLHSKWLDEPRKVNEEKFMFGGPLQGALAEYMVIDENAAVLSPAYLSDEEASTLPIAGLTAWYALNDIGNIKPGKTVLIQGTGGVAIFAVQIAKALGAISIVTTSKNTNGEKALKLGATHFINYTDNPNWQNEVLRLTNNTGVDEVLEVVGGDLTRSIQATKTAGLITLIGFLDNPEIKFNLFPVIVNQIKLQGIATGHRKAFEQMNAFLEQHQIKPVIDSVYSFENAPDAFRHFNRGTFGKIVIKMN